MGASLEQGECFMREALALAMRGAGRVAPNPPVGCVIVKDDKIVGRGWHDHGPGHAHAEVHALEDAGAAARGAVAYVTLEPCNHTGRTGPCSEALLKAGIAKVVYAAPDPNPLAQGGAAHLRAAGVEAVEGPLKAEALDLTRGWRKHMRTGRPHVIAKFAASLDGKIAAASGESQWITGPASRRRVHQLRAQIDAILVGADTVTQDDPSLTARADTPDAEIIHEPLRIVLDSTGRTAPGAKVYDRSGRGALLATTTRISERRSAAFERHGVEIAALPRDHEGCPDLDCLLDDLGARGVTMLMIEGGGGALGGFFDAGLVDEVWAFLAPVIIGGDGLDAIGGAGAQHLADALRLKKIETEILTPDILVRGRISGD